MLARICVHYVPTTADAPPSVDWARSPWPRWRGSTSARSPSSASAPRAPTAPAAATPSFDVYLKDLGAGLYGYCAPEFRKKARTASGFCVLDNDYAAAQFPSQTPEANLTVTAAHEFFHAVQYSYDYDEDPWMLESTATWMEEQVADDINDNRQYLPASQMQAVVHPARHLQHEQRLPVRQLDLLAVPHQPFRHRLRRRRPGQSAGSLRGDGGRYSIEAIQSVLRKKKKSFTDVYADFAAANIAPANTYAEAPGVPEYANPAVLADVTLSRGAKSHKLSKRVNHLSSEAMLLRPSADFAGSKWRLRVRIKGSAKVASPAARLLLFKTNGKVGMRKVKFTKRGRATTDAPFSSAKIAAVAVVFANVSTRFRCGKGTDFACQGVSRDDRKKFTVVAKAVKKKQKKKRR